MATKQNTGHATEGHANVSEPTDQPASRYTPGPWIARSVANDSLGRRDDNRWFVHCGDLPVIAVVEQTRGEAEPNARLIAAAPELVEALREVVFDLTYGTTDRWKGQGSAKLHALLARVEAK